MLPGMSLAAGTRVGIYEIVGSLGAGGMGEVYRAHDAKLQRDVAIKVLSPQLASTAEARARFEREALSVAKLSHPNIVSIYEFGDHNGLAYVVSELIDGETLRARLEAGPLPSRRAIAYASQIARGIASAHSRGIVHRDLKRTSGSLSGSRFSELDRVRGQGPLVSEDEIVREAAGWAMVARL